MERLDTVRAVETPENITLHLHLAGPVPRVLAWVIDSLIKYAVLLLAMLVLVNLGDTGLGLGLILFFAMEWFYPIVFELTSHGATPGKRALGLRVVNDNGTPLDLGASLIRNLLRAVDFLPAGYAFGLISMVLNRDFKRLGDLAAGTVVIYREAEQTQPSLDGGEAAAPAVTLSVVEQRLLLDFVERGPRLSAERRAELADLLQPLTGRQGAAGVERLQAHARWLAGVVP